MSFLQQSIELLPQIKGKAVLLKKELQLHRVADMIDFIPFRYEKRKFVSTIKEIKTNDILVQVIGKITGMDVVTLKGKTILKAVLKDETGILYLSWFNGIHYYKNYLKQGNYYKVSGRVKQFNKKYQMLHPEIELFDKNAKIESQWIPIYRGNQNLKRYYINQNFFIKLIKNILPRAIEEITEPLPQWILSKYQLMSKKDSIKEIHMPSDYENLEKAKYRLKLEEFLFFQLQVVQKLKKRKRKNMGYQITSIERLHEFYHKYLSFELTDAQKRVVREIYADMKSGYQMNRLLQGDVGSGKTIVAFLTLLIAISNKKQCCFMVPTSILAEQHFYTLNQWAEKMSLKFVLLMGSTKPKEKKNINEALKNGEIHCVIATHALIEQYIEFQDLGLCIIDEQHRFGVAQRAALWEKANTKSPHILVMTATPIPRTLSMSLYGDLDISIIDQLPKGRIIIKTKHSYDFEKLQVYKFIREEINKKRQVYIVYPLIEESEKIDYQNLIEGYGNIKKIFPTHNIGMLHGRLPAEEKASQMQAFSKGITDILVSTTVIEVGVDVPKATIMMIEDADRFGLAQLHQLRGRVGRSNYPSYCFLITKKNITPEARIRVNAMKRNSSGFNIAEIDLQLRGAGDVMGTRQSGLIDFKYGDICQDRIIMQEARHIAKKILETDLTLKEEKNQKLKEYFNYIEKTNRWKQIS